MNIFKAQKSSSTVTDFTNYSLFIPSISVGNVGQLAIDLLISSLDMQKAGILYHAAIIGYIGNVVTLHLINLGGGTINLKQTFRVDLGFENNVITLLNCRS